MRALRARGDVVLRAHFVQARVNVPDDRYRWLVDLYKPKSSVPAFLDVVDIAGLVKCDLHLVGP